MTSAVDQQASEHSVVAIPATDRLGLKESVAVNVAMIVGSGIFLTIPLIMKNVSAAMVPLVWLAAIGLMSADGFIWCELARRYPGSGGSYRYFLEGFGEARYGKFFAFLFIWQFLWSGPLEVATGLISMAQVLTALTPEMSDWCQAHSWHTKLFEGSARTIALTLGPKQLVSLAIGTIILAILLQRIAFVGKVALTFTIVVIMAILWIIVVGWWNPASITSRAEQLSEPAFTAAGFSTAMTLAMYCFLGYYHVCYISDELKTPERTVPRAVVLSILVVSSMFLLLHGTMLKHFDGVTISGMQNLPAEFMRKLYGAWAALLVSALLVWSSFGSTMSAMLGYSRVPYSAARLGHFFRIFDRLHPVRQIPHVSLYFVAALTLLWTLFDLSDVIDALLAFRIIGQFAIQVVLFVYLTVVWDKTFSLPRKLACLLVGSLALTGWLFLLVATPWPLLLLAISLSLVGVVLYGVWTFWSAKA